MQGYDGVVKFRWLLDELVPETSDSTIKGRDQGVVIDFESSSLITT